MIRIFYNFRSREIGTRCDTLSFIEARQRHKPAGSEGWHDMANMSARKLAVLLTLSLGTYAFIVRPRLLRWGATDKEMTSPYPGADLIPDGKRSGTMAVTIKAPPAKVWPWLVQMGYRRAGWYSWDYLDNFGRRSADRIHPEWQNISVGDVLVGPDASTLENAWEVAALVPEHFLGLRASFDLLRGRRFNPSKARPRYYTDSLWGFLLEELPGSQTRLVVSGYWSLQPRWLQDLLSFIFLEWTHWIMQTRQFANLKRRTELPPMSPHRARFGPDSPSAQSGPTQGI
ncbi:MAG: hypothetical protein ACXWNK_15645 [Vulcanimicrobiaceae bacterium]